MTQKMKLVVVVLLLLALTPGYGRAQATVRLSGSVSPAAAQIPNAVAAPGTMPIEIRVVLALRNTDELEQLKRDQQDPSSPSYHKWLTAGEFNARFGPRQADADAVAQWLTASGFSVESVDLEQRVVRASASASVVKKALDTTIVTNGSLYANLNEPAAPAALAPLIGTIEGLSNTFARKPLLPDNPRLGPPLPAADQRGTAAPDFKGSSGLGFSPADFRTYYNESALIKGGTAGTKAPDCIALAAVSDVHATTFSAFTSKFVLPAVKLTKVYASGGVHPGFNGAEGEADLDVEYSHAVAPSTPTKLYIGEGTNDLQDAISRAVNDNVCGVLSISFGYCGESSNFFKVTLDSIFTQAMMQGQTVFVSAGDTGAAGLIFNGSECVPGSSPSVSEMCADPNVTCVGGTQFSPHYNSLNKDTSTVLDGLDSAWDESSIGATGGGISGIFARPSWQTGTGVPAGTMRLVPDVALGAALFSPGYYTEIFSGGKNHLEPVGGTSLSSPAWAGYSRLIGQVFGSGRLGLMNPQLYALGNMGSDSGLIDVIAGNNDFNFVTGYSAGIGYDMTTGWGSPDMSTVLISYLAGGQASVTPVTLSDPPKTVIADAGVLTLSNSSMTSSLSVNSVTVNLTRPSIFKSLSMTSGAQTVTPLKSKTMVFKFVPPIAIPASSMANFTLGATMVALAQTGTPQSVQSIHALGVSAVAGSSGGVTFTGLPASLGSVTLTH